jgi:hypothetical protein
MLNLSRKLVTACVIPCSLVALAACSSGATTTSTSATPSVSAVSAEEFRAEANQVCATFIKDINASFMALPEKPSKAELQGALDQFMVKTAGIRTELAAIEPPAELQEQYSTMLADIQAANAKVKAAGMAFFDRSAPNYYATVDADAAALGLTKCVGDGSDESGSPQPSAS